MPRTPPKPGVLPVYQTKPLQEHVQDSYKSPGIAMKCSPWCATWSGRRGRSTRCSAS